MLIRRDSPGDAEARGWADSGRERWAPSEMDQINDIAKPGEKVSPRERRGAVPQWGDSLRTPRAFRPQQKQQTSRLLFALCLRVLSLIELHINIAVSKCTQISIKCFIHPRELCRRLLAGSARQTKWKMKKHFRRHSSSSVKMVTMVYHSYEDFSLPSSDFAVVSPPAHLPLPRAKTNLWIEAPAPVNHIAIRAI